MAKNSFVAEVTFNPLTVANRKFCYGVCMQNVVVTDISVHETPILQTGNSLIKNIYQSEFFFLFFFFLICESVFHTSFLYWKSVQEML